MDYQALSTARKSAPFTGSDATDLALFNSPDTGTALVARAGIAKNDFLRLTTGASVRLAIGVKTDNATPLSAATIAKWTATIAQARAADPGTQIDLTLTASLGDPVADGVLTTAEHDALLMRQPSLAETKAGLPAGYVVTMDDMTRSH